MCYRFWFYRLSRRGSNRVNELFFKLSIEYFISLSQLPILDINVENKKRPNTKTEFIVDGKIFRKTVFMTENYLELLKKDGISSVLVLEDNKNLRQQIFRKIKILFSDEQTHHTYNLLNVLHPSVSYE